MKYKKGQLVVFKRPDGYSIGKIKKIKDNKSAWIWYHSGDTAALTDLSLIYPLFNDYCIEDILNKKEY